MRHNKTQTKFFYYSLYAWTTPLALTLLVYATDKFNFMAPEWSPGLGENTCWFSRKFKYLSQQFWIYWETGLWVKKTEFTWVLYREKKLTDNSILAYIQLTNTNVSFDTGEQWRGHFLFFLLPIGLHIFINSILFILTSIHCSRVKSEIHKMQCKNDAEQQAKRKRYSANKAKFV